MVGYEKQYEEALKAAMLARLIEAVVTADDAINQHNDRSTLEVIKASEKAEVLAKGIMPSDEWKDTPSDSRMWLLGNYSKVSHAFIDYLDTTGCRPKCEDGETMTNRTLIGLAIDYVTANKGKIKPFKYEWCNGQLKDITYLTIWRGIIHPYAGPQLFYYRGSENDRTI